MNETEKKSKEISSESILKAFSSRYENIMDERDLTAKEYGKLTNVSRTSVTEYISGDTLPSLTTIVNIANRLGVTTDYLCGLSNNASPDIDDVAINRKTGLSHKAIQVLKDYNLDRDNALIPIINFLLEQEEAILIEQTLETIEDETSEKYIKSKEKLDRENYIPIIDSIRAYLELSSSKEEDLYLNNGVIMLSGEKHKIANSMTKEKTMVTDEVITNKELIDFTYFRKIESNLKKATSKYEKYLLNRADN